MSHIERNEAIKRIRTALQKRSGKQWSVKGNRGTAWGYIDISAPPRRLEAGCMWGEDRLELGKLLGLPDLVMMLVLATRGRVG